MRPPPVTGTLWPLASRRLVWPDHEGPGPSSDPLPLGPPFPKWMTGRRGGGGACTGAGGLVRGRTGGGCGYG